MAKSKDKNPTVQIGFWHAVRDIFVASINKGQFPLAVMAAIGVLVISKMPSEDVSKLVFEVLGMLHRSELVGYFLSVFGFGGWYFHTKWQRQMITNEMRRISEVRTIAQGSKIGNGLIKSSEEAL
ncbi:MAG TPA: hypothetical protein VIY48_08870 [Candidatus Paceibacterota bacterium]